MKKVVVIGQGYVGLPIAVSAAKCGFNVIGFDINENLTIALNQGNSHIEDIPAESVKDVVHKGKYKATSNPADISEAEIAIIAVPTPLNAERNPDLSFLISASQTLGENLKNASLIVNESTSYPGTLRNVVAKKVTSANEKKLDHRFAISPERVDPGNATWKVKNTPRLFAGLTKEASEMTREFYSKFCDNLIEVSTPEVAEAAKLFENTFRQVNIALVNEFALIMNKMNVPVSEVLDAAASKPYGFMKFTPGIGVGGHCIPVDPIYLEKAAEDAGAEANFIKLANEVNLKMPVEIANRVIVEIGGSIKGKRVLVCGIAYKSNISDTRETPSEILVDYLQSQGANVSWHDPLVESWRSESGVSKLTPGEFDVVIIATLHEAMNQKDLVAAGKYVFDCTGRVPGAVSL